ncbi:RNA polymerase sigma factor [Streptomyces lavendulocolor]|uniref:RNA polymerase sigma factor n=1 Tax=Streptomyces lavendulocolor TaxID=67316 RepID=UPI003C2BA3DC
MNDLSTEEQSGGGYPLRLPVRAEVSATTSPEQYAGFEELHEKLREVLLRKARAELRSEADARDAVAATFEAVAIHWHRIREMDAPVPYVWTVFRNKVHDVRQMRVRLHPVDDLTLVELLEQAGDGWDPHGQTVARLTLWAAVECLPERQRHVFMLRRMEDLPARETAEVLGVREGTVNTLLSRAEARLRRVLAAEGPPMESDDGTRS